MCELPSPYRSKNLKVVFVRWKVLVNLIIKFVDEIVAVVYSRIINVNVLEAVFDRWIGCFFVLSTAREPRYKSGSPPLGVKTFDPVHVDTCAGDRTFPVLR